MKVTPSFLLGNPELITPVAPWCVILDNLELGILLLAQPWLAGEGLRRADLQRQLGRLAAELPLGPVYFQRVKRAVARLEAIAAVRASGDGRTRRFVATPQGFAALVLNLRVLHADPTFDGSEFELKRALVAMWNLLLQRLEELPEEVLLPPETERFLDQVERLAVLGERVITDEVAAAALDILRLIDSQRGAVEQLLAAARGRLVRAEAEAGALSELDLSRLAENGFAEAASLLTHAPGTLAVIRSMASGALPRMSLRATVLRYVQYLRYLDELASMYASELETVDLTTVRSVVARPGA